MIEFKNCAAQGDLMIRRVKRIPKGFVEMGQENGEYIVAHSETGHHHVISGGGGAVVLEKPGDIGKRYIKVEQPVALEHRRDFDTHKTLIIPKGLFELRRQREHSPEGWQYVMD